jgi:hypothetical protein
MSDTIETVYPSGYDESTAAARVTIEYDDNPGYNPWEDNDGWCSVIVPFTSQYLVSAHPESLDLGHQVQSLYRNGTYDRATLARWVRIVTGGAPVKVVGINNDYQALVFLDPARCEESGADLTEATLDAEVREFADFVSGAVYGLTTETRTPETYQVGDSTGERREGGYLTESRSFTTDDRDAAELMAARWGCEVETIEPEWVEHPEDETVWGVIGYDYALTEAKSMADAAQGNGATR